MTLALQIRRYALQLASIVAMVGIALLVGSYILAHQRVRFPWEDVYTIAADFTSAQAVTPGQGQTVAVAGVTVGEVAKVTLHGGLARVEMQIERDKLRAVHADARMLLRPKTGLQDMSVELDPGTAAAPALKDGQVLPAAQTKPNVNADEVLSALDGDTRAWLQTLVSAGSRGVRDQGVALRRVLKAGAPTLERTRTVTRAIVARRGELRSLIHDLRLVADAAAAHDTRLARLVEAGDATFRTLADHDTALRAALARLPGTLDATRDALDAAQPFARRLGPAAAALRPALRALTPALPQLDPLLRDATPATRRIRGLVRDAKPAVADLRPTLRDLAAVTPKLSDAFSVLNYVVNELAYNPPGPEEGYLFWLAWFNHNANSILTVEDAHGATWRGAAMFSCSSYAALSQLAPLLALAIESPACPKDPTPGGRG